MPLSRVTLQQVIYPVSAPCYVHNSHVAGIQSDDTGTLRCLKPGTNDGQAEIQLSVQGMSTC